MNRDGDDDYEEAESEPLVSPEHREDAAVNDSQSPHAKFAMNSVGAGWDVGRLVTLPLRMNWDLT